MIVVATFSIRATAFIARATAELAALGLLVGMIALWSAIAAGA